MDETLISRTLDAVYDAATAPALWPEALRQLGTLFGCSCVSLVDRDVASGAGRAVQWGIDEASEREYVDVWLGRNVFNWQTKVWRQGEVETDQDVMPKRVLLRSDYYNGFLKPRDMYSIMRVATRADGEMVQLLSLNHPQSGGDYGRSDAERLQPLVRHIQRAATISRHLTESREALSGISTVLEQSSTGIVLLSRNAAAIFVNRAARSMIAAAAGLRLREGRLSAIDRTEDAALQKLIAGALGRLHGIGNARGGAIRIAANPGVMTTIVVGPLEGHAATSDTSPAAFVLVADPDRGSSHPTWMLQSLYDLSAAEAAVAQRLMMGDSPEQAAAALSIKISTARWHISALFRKTDTRRQAELVRLLLSLPRI